MSNLAKWISLLGLVALPAGSARADGASSLTIVEESSKHLTVSVKLLGRQYFSGDASAFGQQDAWFTDMFPVQLFPEFVTPGIGFVDGTRFVNWIEPDDPHAVNTLVISTNGSGGTTFIIGSDLGAVNYDVLGQQNNGATPCTNDAGQFVACPILADGASYEVPLFTYANGNSGTLTVRFTDRSDSGIPTPEPDTLAILAIGLAGLGLLGRRRAGATRRS